MKNTLKANHLGTRLPVFLQTYFSAWVYYIWPLAGPEEIFFFSFKPHLIALEERLAFKIQTNQIFLCITEILSVWKNWEWLGSGQRDDWVPFQWNTRYCLVDPMGLHVSIGIVSLSFTRVFYNPLEIEFNL